MPQQITGFLPFGSTDNRVKFHIDLTSEANLIAAVSAGKIAAYSLLGAGGTFSEEGFLPTQPSGGIRLTLPASAYQDLDYHAEIAVEVESDGITIDDAAVMRSYGTITSGEYRIIDAFSTWATGQSQFCKSANKILTGWTGGTNLYTEYLDRDLQNSRGNNAAYALYPHSDMHGKYTTINIDVKPNNWSVGLDGVDYIQATKSYRANQFKDIVIGCDRGASKAFTKNIRQIQVAARDVVIPCVPLLRHVAVLSDSMFNAGNITNPGREGDANVSFRQELGKKGLRCGVLSVNENGGKTTTELAAFIPDVLALHPSAVLYRGLTNDITSGTEQPNILDGTTLANMKVYVEEFLGLNGNTATTVERLVIGTPPNELGHAGAPDDALPTYVVACQAICADLLTWYESTYGDGKLAIADVYNDTGGADATWGDDPKADLLVDGTHMYPRGNMAMGRSYAKALL